MNLNNNGVIYQLAYLQNASFLAISDLVGSHIAQSKENMQKRIHFFLCFRFCDIT
jgi:hypothetical protein